MKREHQHKQIEEWMLEAKRSMINDSKNIKDVELPNIYLSTDEKMLMIEKNNGMVTVGFNKDSIQHEMIHYVLEQNGHEQDPQHLNEIGKNFYWKNW